MSSKWYIKLWTFFSACIYKLTVARSWLRPVSRILDILQCNNVFSLDKRNQLRIEMVIIEISIKNYKTVRDKIDHLIKNSIIYNKIYRNVK